MKKLLPILLLVSGLALIVVGWGADLLGVGGDPGIGAKQIALIVIGVVVGMLGITKRYSFSWRTLFTGPGVSPTQLFRMALCFGMLAGLLEVLTLVIRKWGLGIIFNLNPHLFWMKPLANPVFFIFIGLILMALAWRWPRLISLRTSTFILVFLAALAPLLAFSQLHDWAKMLLALGITVQVSKTIVNHPEKFATLAHRAIPWLAGAVVVICLGFYASMRVPEYLALAKLSPARPNTPNVLLLVMDTVRAKNLNLYGYNRPTTPRLKQFAESGVCFENALSTAPWTLSAHATMFTGRLTHELFEARQTPADAKTPVDDRYPTLAEILSNYGYLTGSFVGNVGYLGSDFGLDRGFSRYEDHIPTLAAFIHSPILLSKLIRRYRNLTDQKIVPERKTAADVNRAFLHWQAGQHDRPFFGFINYFDAHDPYIPPEPFDLKFGRRKPDNAHIRHDYNYSPGEIEELRDAYDSCIAYLDQEVASLLSELENRGVLKNTIVIITSDHGEQFGEHGLMYHVNSLYRELLQVPLVISFPGKVPANRRIGEPVSLRDLPRTILDLIGLEDESRIPGISLARHWNDARAATNGKNDAPFSEVFIGGEKPDWFPESWPVNKGSMQSLVSEGYHYIRYGDGSEDLFDFENDPDEIDDLVGMEESVPILTRIKTAVKTMFFPERQPGNDR